jgi:hypothetical protein
MKVSSAIVFLITIFGFWMDLRAKENATCLQTFSSQSIREKMNLIDPKDLSLLEDLFRRLFNSNSFAYTLFGPKPMTFNGWNLAYYDGCSTKHVKICRMIDFLGWKTWQKYSYLFPSKNFYFTTPKFVDTSKHFSYVIFNKKRCEEIITKYLSAFQENTETKKTIQEILDSVCSSSFFEIYKNKKGHITCLGLLLGYGEQNSQACERRSAFLIQALYQAPYHLEGLHERMKNRQEYFHVGLQPKESIEGLEQPLSIQSVIEGLNELHRTYRPIALVERNYLCPIGDVRCAGMSEDPETKALQEQYQNIRQKLVDIYNAENFLELVLTQLSS